MMRVRIFLLLVILTGLGISLPNIATAEDVFQPRIVNGLFTSNFPTTGALLFGNDPATASSWCSGTLIGCGTFLTAAHCVCDSFGPICQEPNDPNPDDYKVFLQHAGLFSVHSITVRGDFNFPEGDVAVVKLAAPVNGIPPTPINTTQSPPFGTPGIIAGFGRSGGNNFDYGLKRYGSVTTDSCPIGVSNTTSVCWVFNNPVGVPGTDSNTCNADSGGPLFVDFGDGEVVAGITSGGTGFNCLPTDQSYDADVFFYRNWIQTMAGPDILNTSCGDLPQLEVATDAMGFAGIVSAVTPEGRHAISVPPNTRVLRVSMNSEDDGQNFDLYVKAGGPPSTIDFDCAGTGSGQYASCEFDAPVAGTWEILVQRVSGSGDYQVTATAIPDIPRGLTVVLSSDTLSIPPGGVYPFTMALTNETGGIVNFELTLSLILPNGASFPLVSGVPLTLPDGASVVPTITLPLPAGLPSATFGVGVSLTDPVSGIGISESYLSFDRI
jgi:hypothetical protein